MVKRMKVKIFDLEDESDLENEVNNFIEDSSIEVIDIKYQVSVGVFSEEQVFCFSAMIIYTEQGTWKFPIFMVLLILRDVYEEEEVNE